MARKKDNEDIDLDQPIDELNEDDEEKVKGGKIWSILIALVIIVIWFAIFGLLIKMDVGGFGSTVLRPLLKDVPVVNMILPDATDEEVAAETGYKYKNLAEAVDRIKVLEQELQNYQNAGTGSADQIQQLNAEIQRLKTFENNQVYYEELKKQFDQEVVFNDKAPDINEYKAWYEQLNPENAASIYEQVLLKINYTQQVKDWADTYSRMDAAAAAAILEEMTGDINLVSDILLNIRAAQRAQILAAMDSVFAAKVTKVMYPTDISNTVTTAPTTAAATTAPTTAAATTAANR